MLLSTCKEIRTANCINENQRRLLEKHPQLKQRLFSKDETFQEKLMHLIWDNGLSEIKIYKDARIDRRLFSKIRSDTYYHPQKQTILPILIALRLNIDEAEDLLSRAGYTFSPSDRTDIIYRYCIENSIFDFNVIDDLIYS
jgi:hypothetical protein